MEARLQIEMLRPMKFCIIAMVKFNSQTGLVTELGPEVNGGPGYKLVVVLRNELLLLLWWPEGTVRRRIEFSNAKNLQR